MKTILDRIKEKAKQNNLTLAEVEKLAGIGNGVIRRWNKANPTVDKINLVARVLNTSLEYLINGKVETKAEMVTRKINRLNDDNKILVSNMIDTIIKTRNSTK